MIFLEDGEGCEWVDGLVRIGENSVIYLYVFFVEI